MTGEPMKRQLIWLRSDLRIDDNSALAAAAAKGPVIAVFLRSIPQWQAHGHGANKLDFWARGVAAVRTALNGLNIPLLHRDIERYDQAPKALLEIARQYDVEQLHFNHEYALNERRRDQAVQDAFKQAGIAAHGYQNAAADNLARFLRFRGRHYNAQRDLPKVRGTSELSPYLALGMISHRQCLQAVMSENGGHLADGDIGLTTWVNELVWREFYQHVAVGFPQVCRYQPFQEHTKQLAWRDDDEGFQAWCEGRTGYPIVDAAMRQLVTTGWMHNRLRMITAMFLSKHLLIDWRRGEGFFMRHLVDGEFCANNGGWQWAASTGTDAAPYFRIFNPTTQSTRFDAEGEFIAHWLPELAKLPAKARHAPQQDLLTDVDYPAPIVDHKAARQRALEAFKSLSK